MYSPLTLLGFLSHSIHSRKITWRAVFTIPFKSARIACRTWFASADEHPDKAFHMVKTVEIKGCKIGGIWWLK
jgi:hypothetical protein